MATNPYSYGSLGQRWTVGEPTSKSLLDVSRVKADANRWALEQLIVDPDDTANFVLTAPGLNIDSNTLYVDSVNNSVGFGLTNPNDYAFNGTPSWVASGGAGNASVIVVSGTTSTGYLAFADGTTGTDRYSGNIQYNHGTNTMSFRTNGDVEAMTINSAQDLAVDGDTLYIDASADRVGIGTISPSYKTEIAASASTVGLAVTASSGQVELQTDGQVYGYQKLDVATAGLQIKGYSDGGGTKTQTGAIDILQTSTSSAGGYIKFSTHDGSSVVERARILSSGGITFNGGTSSSEALSDYEQGSWTPTLSGATTATIANQFGSWYRKVGDLVMFSINLQLSSNSDTGSVNISLPFTSSNTAGKRFGGAYECYVDSTNNTMWYVPANSSLLQAVNRDSTGTTYATLSSKYIQISGMFLT